MNWIRNILKFWKTIQLVLMYLVAVLLIYFLFPREGKFRYEYTKNTPWMHETLVAPFDFPVYKPELQLQQERDSLLSHSHLYFRYDSLVEKSVKSTFEGEYIQMAESMGLTAHPADTWRKTGELIQTLLDDIYEVGILERHPALEEKEIDLETVMIFKSGVAEERVMAILYTPMTAYEHLTKQLEAFNEGSLAVLGRMNLNEYLRPNMLYDAEMTLKVRQAATEQLTLTSGMVQSGQRIIALGELVTQSEFLIIESLRREYESNPNVEKNYFFVYIGQALLVLLIFMSLLWFIYFFRKDILANSRYTLFILSLIVVMVALTRAAATNEAVSVYVIPFILVPIFLKTFFDSRFALFVHVITLLLAAFWVPNSYQFLLMNFLVGVVSIFTLRSYYKRGILFYTALFVLLSYAGIYIVLSLLQEGDFNQINWINVLWLAGNSLLIMTVYPLVFIFERVFGFLSDATLFELSDTNQPLLRELAEKAPGTFQHSMQVASLAEEATLKVGGNPLLIRAGALYHDIGKMENPHYFIENQFEGSNPHKDMDHRTSARLIIDHVLKGVEIARKHNLPDPIIDFIKSHHGTSTVQYFYRSFINSNPDREVDIAEFVYPGPRPTSKETAILMMADSVEAASRTLKEYSRESISELVEKIVRHQAEEDQFSQADISYGDIASVKQIFINRLANIYHSRIEYPAAPEAGSKVIPTQEAQ